MIRYVEITYLKKKKKYINFNALNEKYKRYTNQLKLIYKKFNLLKKNERYKK